MQSSGNMHDRPRWIATPVHVQIAHSAYKRFCALIAASQRHEDVMRKHEFETSGYEWASKLAHDAKMEAGREGMVTVTFSAIAAEACINEYGSRRLGTNMFDRIDRLPTLSKWLIVPQLACGKAIPPDSQAIQLLKSVFKHRDIFVHPKSSYFSENEDFEEQARKHIQGREELLKFVHESIQLGKALSGEAKKIDPDDSLFTTSLLLPPSE